jgi:hypothetical protein
MEIIALVGILAISSLTTLAASGTLKLSINGVTSSTPAIVQNGKTYIALEALQKAGIKTIISKSDIKLELPGFVGGANQRASLEGSLDETLFNGVWRVKPSKLERIKKDDGTPGWGLMLEVKNGSKATITPVDAGFDGTVVRWRHNRTARVGAIERAG